MFISYCALLVMVDLQVLFLQGALWFVVLWNFLVACVPLMVVVVILLAVRHTGVVCW